jgi:2-C-methyl-D-erythritol 4-phosphate cytidylyltransferase
MLLLQVLAHTLAKFQIWPVTAEVIVAMEDAFDTTIDELDEPPSRKQDPIITN